MGERKLTYLEVDRLANRFANSLLAQGLTKGDRFTYVSLNSIEMVIMYYGAAKVGVVQLSPGAMVCISSMTPKVSCCLANQNSLTGRHRDEV